MSKKLFSYKAKEEIYNTLKEIWRNSEDITYKDLEKIQIQKWGGVAFKWGTLRNKASIEGWNLEKGKHRRGAREEKKQEIIKLVTEDPGGEPELLESELDEYSLILKGLEKKYRPDFNQVRDKMKKSLESEDLRGLKYVETAIRTIEGAWTMDLKLMGCLDLAEQRKLELEILKVELMTLEKTGKVTGR